jgi:hypothetical protein
MSPKTGPLPSSSPAEFLKQEYQQQRTLYEAQPPVLQRYMEAQARALAELILNKSSQARFSLPDKVVVDPASGKIESIQADQREQRAGGLVDRLTKTDIAVVLRTRFKELEQSDHKAVAAAAGILRYATSRHMVVHMLPAGRTVKYITLSGDDIPSTPDPNLDNVHSAITATTDAIAEEGSADAGRGQLQVPFVPFARKFYLPQWVAFDSDGKLLAKSVADAEANIASMQQFLSVLHTAVNLSAYFISDEEYQRKRYGMLGQLVNQGRALAIFQTRDIVRIIQQRAAAQDLNRGLSLSLPYFDDQTLGIRVYPFEVIPAGRIMFVPAFVVRAAREEAVKVGQDTRISHATRNHILQELAILAEAFDTSKEQRPHSKE